MIVTYKCAKCGKKTIEKTKPPVKVTIQCDCGSTAVREFNNISLDKEDDNVSAAINTMLWSKLPSDKDKINV